MCVLVWFCCYSVYQLYLTLCDPMDYSMPGFPVLHHLLEPAQIHVHQINDAIQPFCPLSSPSPPAFNLSQHQGLFQWVGSSHQVAKVLELRLQHQFFQWIVGLISFRNDWFDLLAVQGTLKSLVLIFLCLFPYHSEGSFLVWGNRNTSVFSKHVSLPSVLSSTLIP